MNWLRILLSVLVSVLVVSCSGGTSGACTPGTTQACLGAGRCEGAQSCLLDGKGYGPCECAPSTGGGTGGGGGSSVDDAGVSDGGRPNFDGGSLGDDGGVTSDGGLASDGGVGHDGGSPTYAVTPGTLTLQACPTNSPGGAPLPGTFPEVGLLTVLNTTASTAGLTVVLNGNDAGAFSLLDSPPLSAAPMSSTTLRVAFSPPDSATRSANLRVAAPGEPPTSVLLTGSPRTLPLRPLLETAPQQPNGSFGTCTATSPLSSCTLEFPDTLMNRSSTLLLKLRNRGCPALKVTGIAIESPTGGAAPEFTIDTPAALPSVAAPLTLSVADGTEEVTVALRFTAVDDGSGSSSQAHFARLKLLSNDPLVGNAASSPALLTLQANAVKPAIYASPTSCNFSNPMDACGNGVRIANRATFRITNDGSTPILISSVKFKSSGTASSANSRFRVSANIQGQTLQPSMGANIEVTEVDMPLLVTDQLEVVADISGQGAGSGGTALVSVVSGIKPCLSTTPSDVLSFGSTGTQPVTRSVSISNGAGCGTLVVNELAIPTQPYFALVAPFIDAGTTVAPGTSVQAAVQYQPPISGGTQLSELRIMTNDTDYGPPQGKLVLLESSAPLDPLPVASLTVCSPAALVNDPNCMLGAMNSASFQLSAVNPDEFTLSGVTSTDNNPVAEYRFTLLPPIPGGATTAALANHGVRISANKTKLTIPSGAVGTYRVGLEVWDSSGQKSANTDVITLNIYP